MRCKHCDSRLAVHDLWCSNCGKQTSIVNTELSSYASLKRTWQSYKTFKGVNVPAAALIIILGLIPIGVIVGLMIGFGYMELDTIKSVGSLLLHLLVISVSICLFVPILYLPFHTICGSTTKELEYKLSWRAVLGSFKRYPQYLVYSLITGLYFVIIYLICFGLPNFGSDPILRLVWLVLVNYFIAVILPVPVLMEKLNINAWKAIRLSYRHFHVVRWQMYLLALILGGLNSIAFALCLVPLIITLPFTWFVIRDYTNLLFEFEVLRDDTLGSTK